MAGWELARPAFLFPIPSRIIYPEVKLTIEKVREKAREIGIDKIGVVPAAQLETEGPRLLGWLGRGYHGEMAWMARDPEKRSDPRLLFPPARSVIAAAVN